MLDMEKYQYNKLDFPSSPTFVYSVLDGVIPGFVYKGRKENGEFLVGTDSGILYAMGRNPSQEFKEVLMCLFQESQRKNTRFTLFSSSAEWNTILDCLFTRKLKEFKRYSFRYAGNQADENELDGIFSIRAIDREHIQASVEFDKAYYKEYWDSTANFLKKGFGYCALHNGIPISECTSIFKSELYAEMDISTKDSYRGKGLAMAVAKAFINRCIEENMMPRWDCDCKNTASIKLGEKLGFVLEGEYSVFSKNA